MDVPEWACYLMMIAETIHFGYQLEADHTRSLKSSMSIIACAFSHRQAKRRARLTIVIHDSKPNYARLAAFFDSLLPYSERLVRMT